MLSFEGLFMLISFGTNISQQVSAVIVFVVFTIMQLVGFVLSICMINHIIVLTSSLKTKNTKPFCMSISYPLFLVLDEG